MTAVAVRYFGESDTDVREKRRREEISQMICIMLRSTNVTVNDLMYDYGRQL
jgi:hypothetical protein